MLKITINNHEHWANSDKEIEHLLRDHEASEYREIWIENDKANMCALAAGKIAWLMFLRFNGDAGFSSRNPNYTGAKDEMLEFMLSNGQMDEYPLSWTLPEETWVKAILHFAKTGQPIKTIQWHDDGGQK